MSMFASCFTHIFSDSLNHLQTRYYAYFTEKETVAKWLVISSKVTQLELRSLMPNIVYDTIFSNISF